MKSPMSYFSNISDPRLERTKAHLLEDILFITISAVICGAESWNDIEAYGRAKEEWLKEHLRLPNGIPSHDTINRVMSMLSPDELEKSFLNWIKDVAELEEGEVISIDGKSIRGSNGIDPHSAVHMVSAWAHNHQLCLGQIKVDQKSNEITAIPKLLKTLDLEGCVVTLDAMGSQRKIAQEIISQKADYILAVKKNQKELWENVTASVKLLTPDSESKNVEAGHGRIESRICRTYNDLSLIRREWDWPGLKSLVEIQSHRHHKKTGKEETETRYYITSVKASSEEIGIKVRQHWAIENSLHWSLDVSFGEDASRKREGNAAENYSRILRIGLNLLKNDGNKKRSLRGKRLDAGWNNDYLFKLLKN